MSWIDNLLNRITMYRLAMYYLEFLLAMAGIFALLGRMPFTIWELVLAFFFMITVCWIANTLIAMMFRVPANTESIYITSFILTLIITPTLSFENYKFMFIAGVIAMASKYIIAIRKKHIFNPAAFAVVVTFFTISQGASWWVGNVWMVIPVLLGGSFLLRKVKRGTMVLTFLAAYVAVNIYYGVSSQVDVMFLLKALIISSPMFFFAFMMFTEPQTSPTIRKWQIVYALIVAVLLIPGIHLGQYYITPEIALVVGNIFAYAVGPKFRLTLTLVQKTPTTANIYDLVFKPDRSVNYKPGQYLEWTLGHAKADTRGNRRYFTIASSPTEDNIRLGVKVYDQPSSFKKALIDMKAGDRIHAGGLAGNFVLPADPTKRLVFLAGGVGITPFRSMVKYLIDRNEKRQIVIFYSNRTADEIVYKDIFDEGLSKLGIRTIYTLTDAAAEGWSGEHGRIDAPMIVKNIADYKNYTYYISGSHQVVTAFEALVKSMGIPSSQIKVDFFPGFV